MNIQDLKIGMIVYHKDVYKHREALKIVAIKEDEIEAEGDFSGGTHNVIQRSWLPLKGTSVIYNYDYKKYCREQAVCIYELSKNHKPYNELNNTQKTMLDLLNIVFNLTTDVQLNKEF